MRRPIADFGDHPGASRCTRLLSRDSRWHQIGSSAVTGQTIAHYRLTARLGEGGMGAVYRATDTKLGREVAIKILPDSVAGDPDRMARFTREAHVLAALNHPNIAAIHGVEDRALVMELVDGVTLPCPAPVDRALEYARQIAEALEYAHEKGVVHRDLKPANIRITPDGMVKVLDFGLAKIGEKAATTNASDSPTLTLGATEAGVILGTAAYMAPEQARGHVVDRRADIWAFGAVLYEMLTGAELFRRETVTDTLATILNGDLDLGSLPAGVPTGIPKLLRRCLERDRRKRLQSMGDARIEIEDAITNPEPAAPVKTPSARHARWWIAAAALLFTAAAGLAFVHLRESSPAPALMRYTIPPLDGMLVSGMALSPDARFLAYTATNKSGQQQLWLRPTDSLDTRPLATAGASPTLFWSPDSRFIAFDSGGALSKIDVSGGTPQILCSSGLVLGGAWGKSGVIVFGGDDRDIRMVSSSGGQPKVIAAPRANTDETSYHWPELLPDGRHIIHTVYSARREEGGIYVRSIDSPPDSGPGVLLLRDASNAQYVPSEEAGDSGFLLFAHGSTIAAQRFNAKTLKLEGEAVLVAYGIVRSPVDSSVVFTAAGTGVLVYRTSLGGDRLIWFDRVGRNLSAIGEPGLHWSIRISPDGARAAAAEVHPETLSFDISVMRTNGVDESRLTFGQFLHPVWSPDGRRIAFSGVGPGEPRGSTPHALYVKSSDGTGSEQLLLNTAAEKKPTDWSGDGRYLVFEQTEGPARHIWVLPVAKDLPSDRRTPQRLFAGDANEAEARISPDGKWIAYSSDESGSEEIYVQAFAPGQTAAHNGKWQVSKGGGGSPRWRRDNRELFYLSPAGALMAAQVRGGSGFETTQTQPLFQTAVFDPDGHFDVSADGQRFLMPVHYDERSTEPSVVILNWTRQLR